MVTFDLITSKRRSLITNSISKNCDVKRAKVIALAFKRNGVLITKSTNRCARGYRNRFTFHAEELLLIKLRKLKAKERFGYITVLIMRWCPSTESWAMAKPCKKCARLLKAYNVNKISYTNAEGTICAM